MGPLALHGQEGKRHTAEDFKKITGSRESRTGDYIMRFRKFIKRFFEWVLFILTGKGPIAREAVDEGLCDYSGQGHDSYGR